VARTISSKTAVKRWVLRAHVLGRVARALHLEDGEHVHAVVGAPALADDEGRTMGASCGPPIRAMPLFVLAGSPKKSTKHPSPRVEFWSMGSTRKPALVERLQHPARAGALADHARARPAAKLESQRSTSGLAIARCTMWTG